MYDYYIGIDIAKVDNFATIITKDLETIVSPFPFQNSYSDFDYFLSKLDILDSDNFVFVMESTGHYHSNLFSFLTTSGFDCIVINPIQTDSMRKQNIRKVKNDKVDCFVVAKTAIILDLNPTVANPSDLEDLKKLTRFRQSLVNKNSKQKVQLHSLIDVAFPEFFSFFSKSICPTSLKLLLDYPTAEHFANARPSSIQKKANLYSKSRVSQSFGDNVRLAAKNSIASNTSKVTAKLIVLSIQSILQHEQTIVEIDNEIDLLMNKLESKITTIPGIGVTNGAVILAELGDISRFDHPSKIVAYAGLDTTVYQSGNFIGTDNKISKRGSTELRQALFNAAFVASNNDPTFIAYYDQLKARGKHHTVATLACARKLVNVIYKILNDNVEYQVQH